MELTRKLFLQGFAATGIAAVAAAAPALADEAAWDDEYDFVVVGSGTATIGALAAAKAGARVLVVEKGSMYGGTTAFAGEFWLPGNKISAARGADDSREAGVAYANAAAEAWGGFYRPETIDAYFDNGERYVDFITETMGYNLTANTYTNGVDYFNIEGQRDMRSARFGTDDHSLKISEQFETIQADLADLGTTVMLETAATALVADGEGGVAGVVVSGPDGELRIRAEKGVLLGTGGFEHNADMVRAYQRGPIYYSMSVATNTGDGIRMAQMLGANVVNMNSRWGAPAALVDPEAGVYSIDWGSQRGKPGAIIVNSAGMRFGDEAAAYPICERPFEDWDNGLARYKNAESFFVCDAEYVARYTFAGASEPGELPAGVVEAQSLEELAEACGIDAEGLLATVERFNGFAETGADLDFHRGESYYDRSHLAGDASREELASPTLGPIATPPFYAMKYCAGTIGTCGGLDINGRAQVLNALGEPIGGLYACGNTTGGVFGGAYPGAGATIGSGFFMAYAAAADAIGF